MSQTEYVFWASLSFGCINLQPKDRLQVTALIFSVGLMLMTHVIDFESFGKYVVRLAALSIFGALAIKLNSFGSMLLFLCLLFVSVSMVLINLHYLTIAIILFLPVALIGVKKMPEIITAKHNFLRLVLLMEQKIANIFLPLVSVAVALPFGLLIAKIPLK